MGDVIVMNWLSLDGVMQSPGRAGEDPRDGFAHGGWAAAYSDEATVAAAQRRLMELTDGRFAWLFGRRSYEEMLAYWNAQGGPFKDGLNNIPKYVASSDPDAALRWPHSTLLHGDAPAAVAELGRGAGPNLVIMGSGVLIGSLMAADLIDVYLLMIAPVVLGAGRRMFAGDTYAPLRLVDCEPTSTGALITTYERGAARE
ncbi:MAG TPA: dihydrofolate reductase family protein [Solirubrobacteraceae bacterium]|nr:dihydrofolate reductase family protein [Solirubrobacteraceae bacterium]